MALNNRDLNKKDIDELFSWWNQVKKSIHSQGKQINPEDIEFLSLPQELQDKLRNLGISSDREIQEILKAPYVRFFYPSTEKYVENLKKELANHPIKKTTVEDVNDILETGKMDSNTVDNILQDLESRIKETNKILSLNNRESQQYRNAVEILNKLQDERQKASQIKNYIARTGNSFSYDDELERLEGLRVNAIKALKSEGIQVADNSLPEKIFELGKNSKLPETKDVVLNLFAASNSIPLESAKKIYVDYAKLIGVPERKSDKKLNLIEDSTQKEDHKTVNRPYSYVDSFRRLGENDKVADLETDESKREIENKYRDNIQNVFKNERIIDDEVALVLSDPEKSEKFNNFFADFYALNKEDKFSEIQTQIDNLGDLDDRIIANTAKKALEKGNRYQDKVNSLDKPDVRKRFEELLKDFKTLSDKGQFEEIKKKINDTKDPFDLALAQTARRVITTDKWNRARKDRSASPRVQFIERSALEGNRTAVVLPEASKILAENDLLDEYGTIDLEKINGLPEENKKSVKGQIIKKLESYEIKSHLIGELETDVSRLSNFGIYLQQKEVSDPQNTERKITLNRLIARNVSSEIADSIGEGYAELKERYGDNIVEINKNLLSFWQKRAETAAELGTFSELCRKAVENSMINVEVPDITVGGTVAINKEKVVLDTAKQFESMVISLLKNNPQKVIPKSILNVNFATQDEYQNTATTLKISEKSIGIGKSYNLGQSPTQASKNQVLEEEFTHEFVEIAGEEEGEYAIKEVNESNIEEEEINEFYGNRMPIGSRLVERSEELNEGITNFATSTLNLLFNPKELKKERMKQSMKRNQNTALFLVSKVFGTENASLISKIIGINDLARTYTNPEAIKDMIWDKGILGTSILRGGLKPRIWNKITAWLGLRRKVKVGGEHEIEVNLATYGLSRKINSLFERIIGSTPGKFLGWNKSLSYSKRNQRKSLLETIISVTISSIYNLAKNLAIRAFTAGRLSGLSKFWDSRLLEMSTNGVGSFAVRALDTLKIARHFGRASLASLQSGVVGFVIGSLVAGPVGGIVGAVAFGGKSFVNSFQYNENFMRDCRIAFSRLSDQGSKGGKFLNIVANAYEGKGFAVNAIQGNSFFARLARGLSGSQRLSYIFKYFKNGTIATYVALLLGANPLGAIALGAVAVAGDILITSLASRISGVASKALLAAKNLPIIRVFGKFPVFDALGIGYGLNYAVEQIRLVSRLVRGEITPEEFNAEFFSLMNIANGLLSGVGLYASAVTVTSFIVRTIIPSIATRLIGAQGLAYLTGAGLNPLIFTSTLVGGAIGALVVALLGGGTTAIILGGALGAIGGGIGAALGLFGTFGIGTVPFFLIGTGIGTAIGAFVGSIFDRAGQIIGGIGLLIGSMKLFNSKNFIELIQSLIMLSFSMGMMGTVGLGVFFLFPAVFSFGQYSSVETIVNITKVFDKKVSDNQLQYTIFINPSVKNDQYSDFKINFKDTVSDPSNVANISSGSFANPSFSLNQNVINYSYASSALFQDSITFTYIVTLTKPLLEIAATSNFCNSLSGSTSAIKLVETELNTITENINQTICIDKNGKIISKTIGTGLYRPELGGQPIDSAVGVIYQCSFSPQPSWSHHTYRAIDIDAGVGTPIFAWGDGEVVKLGNDSTGYGTHVILKHTLPDKTLYTIYAHMKADTVKVAEGNTVKMGQQIGEVGLTGNTTGAHLHFQVSKSIYFTPSNLLEPCCYINCISYKSDPGLGNYNCQNIRSSFYTDPRNSCSN